MSRVVLPTLSDVDVKTARLSLDKLQKHVEDLEGRIQSIDAGTGGAHASLSTIVATSLRYQAYP